MIRLMSSNIWGDYFGNEVAVRERQLEKIYRKYLPDVLGLQEMGVEINDLFSLMLDHREDGICEDQIHLNALGIGLCAAQVAQKIKNALLETDHEKGA